MTTTHTILDGVLLSTLVDNEDGTGICTYFASDGTVTSVEERFDLPIPIPDQTQQIEELQATVDALLALIVGE